MDQRIESHSERAYKFYDSLGSPKYICAPMVEQSELAFRILCRNYGCDLAYTPMLHSRIMTTTKGYLNDFFSTCPQDRPLFAQLCGNDPDIVVQAAKMLENHCDAIDLNFGCPQGIAKRGNYGSFLLEKPEIMISLVKALHQNIKVPVTCKIRILKSREKTVELAKSLQDAGCSILCVHGRTKEQNKERVGECDWEIIKEIKNTLSIPVFANGGIYSFADVERCLLQTGVDGVMSAEALLENPALFSGKLFDLDDLAFQYINIARDYKAKGSEIKPHLFKILHTGLQQHVDLRERLAKAMVYDQFYEIVVELRERRKEMKPELKFGWYFRYQNQDGNKKKENVISNESDNNQQQQK